MTAPRRPAAPIAEYLLALADARRLRIVFALAGGERSVAQLAVETGMGRDRIARHLVHLRRTGAVAWRRERRRVLFRLAGPEVVAICEALCGEAREGHPERTVGSGLGCPGDLERP